MRHRVYWGLAILIIGLIGAGCVLLIQHRGTEPTERILKPPPEGETFATGHWRGDKWHRTVPKNPETITYNGEKLTLDELYNVASHIDTSWKEKVAILKLFIAKAPYSNPARSARKHLAMHDENGKKIQDDSLLFERLKPLLKYHPSSLGLLYNLLYYGWRSHPEEAIRYGKEGLKYIEMYPMDSGYRQYTELIHHRLGYAYQIIGDYDTALEHLNQALDLYHAYPGRTGMVSSGNHYARRHRDRILEGDPALGPLSKTPILPEKFVIGTPD